MFAVSTGCASFDLNKRIPWGTSGEDGKPVPPMRLMAVWADTVMTTPGKPAMRGFGGRICFYDQANEAVKVKGTLIVYAFDETGRAQTNVTPDRKFVFMPEDFEKHYSKGRLGHSYSFWLPWDEVGGRQTEISLIVRFQPEKGGEIVGEQTKHLLPGLTVDMAAAKNQFQGMQQQALLAQQVQMQNNPQGVARTNCRRNSARCRRCNRAARWSTPPWPKRRPCCPAAARAERTRSCRKTRNRI
ncbi:MAG: hypothetical protein QM811_10965 [Pirellulales bacterium]